MSVDCVEAMRRLEGHKLVPLADFPGALSKAWKLRCAICGGEVEESVLSVEKRSRPGCRACCSVSQNRISSEEALRRLREFRLSPLEPYPGTVGASWKVSCDICGKEMATKISAFQNRKGTGCSQCGLDAVYARNAISSEQAIQRLLRVNLDPLEPFPGNTHAPWNHRCQVCGFEDNWSLNYLESNYPCRICRQDAAKAERDKSAILRMRATGAEPVVPYPGASKPWRSVCMKCGEEISPSLMSAERQSPCKYCARRKVSEKRRDEARPKAQAQLKKSGFEPMGEFRGFTRPWKAKCLSCGQTSSPSAKDLAAGHGCRWCARNAPWTPQQLKRVLKLAKRTALEEFAGASTAILMRCDRCGAEAKAKPSLLKDSKGYCQRCKLTAEWNAEKAIQVMRAGGMEPLEPYKNAVMPWRARCMQCGTEGSPAVTNIASGQGGCKVCGNFGFDVNKPSTLYVLLNRELGAVKVGITNTGSTRLRALAGVGFVPGRLYEFRDGSEPLRIETLLLRHIRKELGLKQALKKPQMRGVGGATETFWAAELSTRTIYARIRSLIR
jgi:hypothetical protein